jgi:hypothetical protein
LTRAPAACQNIQYSGRGSGCSVTGLWRRTHASLERGGAPPEGAHSPRAKWSFARGGHPALERGRVSLEGVNSPRARWSFGVTTPGPSSEAEFCPRGAGAGCLLGRWCYLGRGCTRCNLPLVSSFVFLLFCKEMGFPSVIRGPLWLSPTIAPEPLQWCPLGTRRG